MMNWKKTIKGEMRLLTFQWDDWDNWDNWDNWDMEMIVSVVP